MSNSQLDSFLDEIKSEVIKARSEKDWSAIFQKLKSYAKDKTIAYSFTFHLTIAVLAAAVTGVLWYSTRDTHLEEKEMWLMFSPLLISAAMLWYVAHKSSKISEISELIFYKDVLWDNQLQEIEIDPRTKYKELKRQFGDFDRGDEQHTIETWLDGKHVGAEHSFKYSLYHFRYIVVTYRTVKVGKTTTVQRVETPYHRYGMVVDFPYCEDFAIVNDGCRRSFKYDWETSSEEFNKKYNCHTDNEQSLAKFLKPSTVLALCDFKEFTDMNWELTNKKLCISFDEELISVERKFGIEDPEAFELEIKSKLHLKEINKLKNLVHDLMTNSDNNFERRA